jgi:hypothetical protein
VIPWWLAAGVGAALILVGILVGNELRVYRHTRRRGVDVDLTGGRSASEWDWPDPPEAAIPGLEEVGRIGRELTIDDVEGREAQLRRDWGLDPEPRDAA